MRRIVKITLWAVVGPLLLLLVVLAAWLASNGRWADAAPRPVPPELQPQSVTLAPLDNAFFDAQGLRAPQGESPNAWGQRAWQGLLADGAGQLVLPQGDDWHCQPHQADCMARWRGAAPALKAQMAGAGILGERCRALAGRAAFQEPLPARWVSTEAAADALLPQYGPLVACLRWLHIEAVLAPDTAGAHAAFGQADALLRLMAAGTQTLIGQAVTWAMAARHLQLLAQWSAERPAGETLPAAWLAPLPPRLLQPRTWMAAEAQYQRAVAIDLGRHGEQLFGSEPNALQAWAGRHSLGYLPELTVQATDDLWRDDLRLFGHLQGPALVLAVRRRPESVTSWWDALRWRNPVGQILVEVGRPGYASYALRQADLVLLQAALEASQRLNAVPVAERAGEWARQPLAAGLRERIELGGDALSVRTWRGEVDKAHAAPLRFPLRPA